jgi:hypothetical protein
MLSQIYLTL